MDTTLLNELFPSFLVFLPIFFTISLLLPRTRIYLKEKYDKLLQEEAIPALNIFSFEFKLGIVRFYELYGFAFLVLIFLIILTPYLHQFNIDIKIYIFYNMILLLTAMILQFIITALYSVYKALKISQVR